MTYIKTNEANTKHKKRGADGRQISTYSRYETGMVEGKNRQVMAVIADKAGFDGLGFDTSIGSNDDSWHVANVFTNDNRYIDTIVIGGALDIEHAQQVASTQFDHLAGSQCVIITNPQFDSMANDKPDTWSIDAISKLMNNPSQDRSFLPIITAAELNTEAARVTFDSVEWDGKDSLISHGGNTNALYLDLTKADSRKELTTPLDVAYELELLGAEEESFDALMDAKVRLPLLQDRLFSAMRRASDAELLEAGKDLTDEQKAALAKNMLAVTSRTQTEPFKRQGVTNIAFIFDLSDGQKLSIWFHNPDKSVKTLKPDDVMVSWKWMLNKRDVTAALSPKQGDNVQLPVLAARIMRLARKNSKKFKAAQERAAQAAQDLIDAQALVDSKNSTIEQLDADIASLNTQIDAAMAAQKEEPAPAPEMTAKEQKAKRETERVLAMQFAEVTEFYKNNREEPSIYANDIMEKMLAKRLEAIRANDEFVAYLAPYDTYNLLNDEDAPEIIGGQNNERPPFSEGDPIVWRSKGAELAGTYESYNEANHSIRMMTDDGRMNAPANEVFFNHDAEAPVKPTNSFKVGDPVVWRNSLGELKGTFRGAIGDNITFMTDDGQMNAPANEVFADPNAKASEPAKPAKSKIDAMITKASEGDFDDYNFWIAAANNADVQALSERQWYKLTASLEDANLHGEHQLVSAMRAGNADWVKEAKSINDANKTGLTPELSARRSALWDLINGTTTNEPEADPEAVPTPEAQSPATKTIPIREALDTLKKEVFNGETDKVFMYALNDAGDITHKSLIKASSKSAQTRFSNKHLYSAGVKVVKTATLPDNNQSAAAQLEGLGYTIDYADPEGFTSDNYKVGDVYEMKRKDVFGADGLSPEDTIVMEFTEWLFVRRGADEAKLRLATLSGSNSVNLTVAQMDAIVSRGDLKTLSQAEIDAARDFESSKLISTYVNSKGRMLAEVYLQEGLYDIKTENGSGGGFKNERDVAKRLEFIRNDNPSMKLQSGKEFFADGSGKKYPPIEYDADEKEYIAYMNNKKVDKWTAYKVVSGEWAVVADNAQTRAYNSWNPKYFKTIDELIAAYPAFKDIKPMIAENDAAEYDDIDESEYPSMFLTRNADKLQTLGITDNDIQVNDDDEYYIESGIFEDKTLTYTDAVCKVVDAAIELGAEAAVSDFNATAYQDSLFDNLTSRSKPTYGITVQIVKGGITLRAKIDKNGDFTLLKGAGGEEVIDSIKHVFKDNKDDYAAVIKAALTEQADDPMTNDTEVKPDPTTAELGTVNYNHKHQTLESGEISHQNKMAIADEFMDVLDKKYGFIVGFKDRDFETIHITKAGFATTVQVSSIVPFTQADIDAVTDAYTQYKEEQAAAGVKPWWENVSSNVSVYLIGDNASDAYVRIKNQFGMENSLGDPITKYEFSALVHGADYEYGEDGSLAEIQAFVKEKTKGKGELRLVKGDDVLAMTPASDTADTSGVEATLLEFENVVNADDFNPATFDTQGFIELVNATADNAEQTARVTAISKRYQKKLVAASMAALTSLAGDD